MQVLLDARADVNAADDENRTCLLLAAWSENRSTEACRLLLDHKARVTDVRATLLLDPRPPISHLTCWLSGSGSDREEPTHLLAHGSAAGLARRSSGASRSSIVALSPFYTDPHSHCDSCSSSLERT